ncbi:hypothetical protein HPB47_008859 [Ixodes persulcatus]|uniref:Uncharacterized protein n=1 Tax=Ixodes persulcatus TaxID=34615 RepID=A0AC60P3L0_IXOPE|nr:hypothetical protein HPB47_008859 [Ixodes persulcatus]
MRSGLKTALMDIQDSFGCLGSDDMRNNNASHNKLGDPDATAGISLSKICIFPELGGGFRRFVIPAMSYGGQRPRGGPVLGSPPLRGTFAVSPDGKGPLSGRAAWAPAHSKSPASGAWKVPGPQTAPEVAAFIGEPSRSERARSPASLGHGRDLRRGHVRALSQLRRCVGLLSPGSSSTPGARLSAAREANRPENKPLRPAYTHAHLVTRTLPGWR